MNIDEQIAVLVAKKEGKRIEGKPNGCAAEPWREWTGNLDFVSIEYRIVREPREWNIVKIGPIFYAIPAHEYVPEGGDIVARAVEDLSAAPGGNVA